MIGSAAGESVSVFSVGPKSTDSTRPRPLHTELLRLSRPQSENIRLTALGNRFAPSGSLMTIGGRHVALNSQFARLLWRQLRLERFMGGTWRVHADQRPRYNQGSARSVRG